MSEMNTVEELSEDIEVIGPGQMLAEARKSQNLTQQQVAEKLNFRTTLVRDIEQEKFDKTLPDTFNRGYLKNYAKLVNISCEDVLASYEMLNVAEKQGAEMQSFSKQTEKQAETNRIMWISYLILAILIGSTVMWWFQDSQENLIKPAAQTESPQQEEDTTLVVNEPENLTGEIEEQSSSIATDESVVALSETLIDNNSTTQVSTDRQSEQLTTQVDSASMAFNTVDVNETTTIASAEEGVENLDDYGPVETAEFTFSGDCWVNIYDATGERIAWGIKKTGYVMRLSGQAPFNVTLGKPELVEITYQQTPIDMSKFSQGNIAKFTLPLAN